MPEHEPTDAPENGDERAPEASPEPTEDDRPTLEPEMKPTPQPRELAQRVWGSFPRVPGASPPPPAPPPGSVMESPTPLARLEPAGTPVFGREIGAIDEVDELDEIDELDDEREVPRLDDRLRATEERLAALTQSTQQALTALGDAVHSATRDLPGAIEGVVERRLTAVGDALLKLAELRARLQEETGEAVEGIKASFHSLEERLAEATQERVESSIDRLGAQLAAIREGVERLPVASDAAPVGDFSEIGRNIAQRVSELPTRGDFASVRGAIGNITSSLRTELAEISDRVASVEKIVGDLVERTGGQDRESGPAETAHDESPEIRSLLDQDRFDLRSGTDE